MKGYLAKQLLEIFGNVISKFQFGFRKDYATKYYLLLMLEIWKEATDNKTFGALLTDLSKVFNCLNHMLIAKLNVYDVDIDSLNILKHYLSNRKQRTRVDSVYSSWEAILFGSLEYLKTLYLDYLC